MAVVDQWQSTGGHPEFDSSNCFFLISLFMIFKNDYLYG